MKLPTVNFSKLPRPNTWWKWAILILVVLFLMSSWFWSPPRRFPTDRVITVEPGQDLATIAQMLKDERVIRSSWLFTNFVARQGKDRHLVATYYQFEQPLTLFAVAERMLGGESTIDPVKLRFPEGLNNLQMARILLQSDLTDFNLRTFLTASEEFQGYLFPSTYLVPSHMSTNQLIALFYETFQDQMKPLSSAIGHSGRSLEEVVGMAAILEREAAKSEDRRNVADILWRRYDQGVRLQVDVATTTYKNAGLPDKPIANPSLDSIKAALDPIPNGYWYYLSDKQGGMHYARTYAEHKKNIAHYL